MRLKQIEIILYVSNQQKSVEFYKNTFLIQPSLNVIGMTEFNLCNNVKLGLMPENGIAKILIPNLPHPKEGNGIPRCELYIKVDSAKKYFERAIQSGGKIISPFKIRDWGDNVGYVSDLDGHVIAFAK
jgi:uncharacterized glyoxalase superfamily protein PhnB